MEQTEDVISDVLFLPCNTKSEPLEMPENDTDDPLTEGKQELCGVAKLLFH